MVLGWLWGSSSSNADSVKNLDPSLQQILKSQESQSQQPNRTSRSTPQEITYTEQLRKSGDLPAARASLHPQPQEPSLQDSQSKVPPQSLYQDGRYAHLWKNYEPQHVVEARGETELDKLKRLQDESESRKVALGQAALENCVFEQLAELDCLKNGGVTAKLTMCRPEKQTFSRCYEMQLKFLKALGYWDAVGDPVRADAIQMHSDGLWQRLQEQDKEIQRAKEEGRPLPEFESILSTENVSAVGGKLVRPQLPSQAIADKRAAAESYEYSSIPRELRESFNMRIKDMSREQAKIEEAVFLAETEQKRLQFTEASGYLRAEGDARRKRYETGEATFGDRIKKWTNWDAWDSQFPSPADAQARQKQQEAQVDAPKR